MIAYMLITNDYTRRWRLAITAACSCLLAASATAGPPVDYVAEYGVYRNNKRIARATIKLETTGDNHYKYSRHSKGVKGLARLLNFSETEVAEFELTDGVYRPHSYQSGMRSTGRKRNWQASFDWEHNRISGTKDGEVFDIESEAGLHDPATLQLTLRVALNRQQEPLEFRMLDGNTIEDRKFVSELDDGHKTSIGCTDTVKVDRVRANSNRYTTAWHATTADYIMVRLDHGKRGDDKNSMRLERLTIAGETVTFDGECV